MSLHLDGPTRWLGKAEAEPEQGRRERGLGADYVRRTLRDLKGHRWSPADGRLLALDEIEIDYDVHIACEMVKSAETAKT